MKKLLTLFMLTVLSLGICAQGNRQQRQQQQQRFSPEQFEAQLQEFITKEANLTPQEAAKFFPIYKEMQEKQRALIVRQVELQRNKPSDEEGCKKAIKENDNIDVELKRLLQTYHVKFLDQLPASKVYDILKAEQNYHRNAMRNWGRGRGNGANNPMNMNGGMGMPPRTNGFTPRWPGMPGQFGQQGQQGQRQQRQQQQQ